MAFHAVIIGTQGVYSPRIPARSATKEELYGTTRTYQIAVLHRFPYQLLGDDIYNREAVLDNGIQLLFQLCSTMGGSFSPYISCLVITDFRQRLITVRN